MIAALRNELKKHAATVTCVIPRTTGDRAEQKDLPALLRG